MSLITIILFVLLLSLLIFVHELGHYLTAVRNGIKAEEFGFGFPPRAIGIWRDREQKRWRILRGDHEVHPDATIFSLNWIPFGGFVRIKGEDGSEKGADSFADRPAWTRIKVLGAGVFMNFILAWLLISIVLWMGFPQEVSPENRATTKDLKVQILMVAKGSPAEAIGIKPGDAIVSLDGIAVTSLEQAQKLIAERKGQAFPITIDRFGEIITLVGTPRTVVPEGEGALGISFAETAIVSYPWYQAPIKGAEATYHTTVYILEALSGIVKNLFVGKEAGVDITGPVGIVYMTKQMSELGLAYLLQFAALLSINLGIFNLLPIPGLDGGRIFFVLIEKLKGSPVSQRVEAGFHQIGFILLLLLMIWVTIRDVAQFKILEKLGNLF